MRKLVRKMIVDGIKPIEGADKIELVKIKGWQCVVKKGEFKQGDLGVYFEIDSALPIEDSRYEFLKERCSKYWKNGGEIIASCIKIKTMRMRGEISQGLFLPISEFPELENIEIGEDCSQILHVEHFDELDAKYNERFRCGDQKGAFPSWIPITDEERIQNIPESFEAFADTEFEVTRKVDGSSMTVFYAPEKRQDAAFGVCSRRFELKLDSCSSYVRMSNQIGLDNVLRQIHEKYGLSLAVQGELNGINLNGNRDNLKEIRFNVFKIWDIEKQQYLTVDERLKICDEFGLTHVPVLKRHFKVFREFSSVDEILKFAEGKTENGNEREGVVFKQEGSEHPFTFKAVSNAYLMKN